MREDKVYICVPVAMTPEKAQALQEHVNAIATILYEDTPPEQLKTLESLEATVRQQMLEHVTPRIGVFLSRRSQVQSPGALDTSIAAWENSPSPQNKLKSSPSSPTRS